MPDCGVSMRTRTAVLAIIAATFLAAAPVVARAEADGTLPGAAPPVAESAAHDGALSRDELLVARVCEAVVRLFEGKGAEVWPGYSLAERQFLVYMPDRWALLFNAVPPVDGFGPPPDAWAGLGDDVLYHDGAYDGLIGQLAFSVPVGEMEVVALGFPEGMSEAVDRPEPEAFAYIVHEAFHQYQYAAFGETPWEREERYPIGDLDNAARAWLEMSILEDALKAASAGDWEECARRTAEFVAVRITRWSEAAPFVERYEQGKELLEGTAKYVELRCVELAAGLEYESSLDGEHSPLAASLPRETVVALLLREMRSRRGDSCLEPQDIPRNRIYAVAAAEAYLLDYFGIDWKPAAEDMSPDFRYVELLRSRVGPDDAELPGLVRSAESRYGYETALVAAAEAARVHEEGYSAELEAFESQEGLRMEVTTPSSGLSRSRSSRATKWLMDDGRFSLCGLFQVYTLKAADWNLEIHDSGILEVNDWEARQKEIVWFDKGVASVYIDGEASVLTPAKRTFDSLRLEGLGFKLSSDHPGSIDVTDRVIRVILDPS